MSLAEGQVALCPAVASGGRDLEQRDLGLAAGNSSVLNAELMAQKPAFCCYLCLLDDLKILFGFLCLKMELVQYSFRAEKGYNLFKGEHGFGCSSR